ncbi:hypothetical protein [uncultured Cellulomonas sp.]|uniref:hypothetical protein n=1 Tax=uncultured Cellulomonas sp. TaxID=189682 RepID=UPI0028ECA379|nr:hypothetical protein [uncultured Cellulomonas sp.]
MTPNRPWRRPVCLAVGAALALAGCTSRPAAETAGTAARDFYRAVAAADGAGACALLAPATAEALEDDAGLPCDEAILDGDVGETLTERAQDGSTPSGRVAGRQAQVTLPTDVLFLTVSGSRWLITAAGCDPRPPRPYDCVLEGA